MYDQRLIDGIPLTEEQAKRYSDDSRERISNKQVLEAMTKAAVESYRGNGDAKTFDATCDAIAAWHLKIEAGHWKYNREMWKELRESHDIDTTATGIPLTVWECVEGAPMIYYEYVCKQLMSARRTKIDEMENAIVSLKALENQCKIMEDKVEAWKDAE